MKSTETGLNDQTNYFHVVFKVIDLAAKDPKVFCYRTKLPLFLIKIIEIGLNDQNNDSTCGIQGDGSGC